MRYIISEHAAEGISDRKIPLELVESTLEHPQQIVPEYKGRKCYQSQIAGTDGKMYLLRIIVVDTIDPASVVTAYRTSKIGKYWREP